MRAAKPQIKGGGFSGNSGRITCSTSFQRILFLKEVFRSSRIDRMKGWEERTMKTFLNRQNMPGKALLCMWSKSREVSHVLAGNRKWHWIGSVSRTSTAVLINASHVPYLCIYFYPYSYTPLFWRAQKAPPSKKLQAIIIPMFQFKLFCHNVLAYSSQKECHSKEIPVSKDLLDTCQLFNTIHRKNKFFLFRMLFP